MQDFLKQLTSNPIELGTGALHTFLLVFLRVGGMFLLSPFFGSGLFPARTRVWLSVAVAAVLFPIQLQHRGEVILAQSAGVFLVSCLSEFGLGMLIGFCANVLLFGMMMAGNIIDTEMGYSLATVFDPITNEPNAITGQLLFLAVMVGFVALNGHQGILRALDFSFQRVPLCSANFGDDAFSWILLKLAPQVFIIGVTFAAPVLAAIFLTTVGLGLVARVVPELNIFAFSFALRLAVGLVFLVLSVNYLAPVADRIVQGTYTHLMAVILRLA